MDTQNKEQQELDDHERYQREFERLERECCELSGAKYPTKPPGFGWGFLFGSFCTLVFGVFLLIGGYALIQNVSPGKDKELDLSKSTKEVVTDSTVEEKAGQLADLIDQYYYEKVDKKSMVEGLYAGMTEGLGDPYSTYFSAEEYASFNESTTGVYYGIGTVLTQDAKTKVVTILHVYPGTPAEEAGIRDGDVIAKVDDIAGDSMELSELTTHIKGQEGTTVHIEVIRHGEKDYLGFDVERRQIEVPTVEYEMLEGNVGYIQITEFSTATPEQFDEAIEKLQGQGMVSVIVDLRDNPGGVLQSVCEILDKLLPEGLLVYTEDKYGHRSDYKSDASCMDIPMAVLINGNSASASEIFAGAIKDYKYGTLIGTTSFGKGIVQTIIPLSDGSAIKLTMAKYFTPKGNYIHEVGISPDIELEYQYLNEEDEVYNPMHDNQIQKALEVLKEGE
ncbi:MAG: S41 family peptidase [Lachnospiraceae bacterium]|nr:S41 family peptidase [Lachnospiraceae bacterium]